jgi:phosphatidylglycerol:prolipoprotein diacylglycerol transferase
MSLEGFPLPLAVLTQITWDVSPEIFRLGPLPIRWYSLGWLLAFGVGFHLVRWMYRREGKPEEDLETVAFWRGFRGLASHGGTLGILVSLYLYCHRHPSQPYLWLLDRIAAPTALGGFFIRMGNLMNSEILGRPSDAPWAMVFVRVDSVPRHPAQLYEALSYLAIFFLLLWLYRRKGPALPRGLLTGTFFATVFGARFFIEFVKERHAAFEAGLPLSMGQILSIPIVVLGLGILFRSLRRGFQPDAGGSG